MTKEDKELIITTFKTNRKGFYAWLFRNKERTYLIDELRVLFPNADSDLERVYWLVYNLTGVPTCPTCGKKVPFTASKSVNEYGYNTHCCHKCGTTDPHHQDAIKQTKLIRYGNSNWNNPEKATYTCKQKYGGNGIRGDRNKAKQTLLDRYGVEYYTKSEQINSMRNNAEIQEKIQNTKRQNKTFNSSKPEEEYYKYLCTKYGKENVIQQYKDNIRYPFNCDFYIKSEDLFIELNLFPTHGKEPFNAENKEHKALLEQCKINPHSWIEEQLPLIWAGTDVLKYETARRNKLNYKRLYNIEEGIQDEKSCSIG